NPADTFEWSECAAQNPPGDRRFVIATNDYAFPGNSTLNVAFALVITDTGSNNACPNVDITPLKTVTDTAWKNYHNPPKSSVSVATITGGRALSIHPNPAQHLLHITAPFYLNIADAELVVCDITGKKMNIDYAVAGDKIELDVKALSPGMYNIVYRSGSVQQSGRFIKN